MRTSYLLAGLLAACATTAPDVDETCVDGKCDGAGTASAPVWSRDSRCEVKLVDDTSAAMLCDSWIEVVELADGASRWRHDFAAHRDPRMFIDGDQIWFYVNDGDTPTYRRTIYRVEDGSAVTTTTTNRPPVAMTWSASGTRLEVTSEGALDTQPHWMLLETYDAQDHEGWGDAAFATTTFGMTTVARGADGNTYFGAHDMFRALDPSGSLAWTATCRNGFNDVVLLDDGSPLVRCGSRYSLYDTNTALTLQNAKPSIALPTDATDVRPLAALDRIVTTGPRMVGLYTRDGAAVATVTADSEVAADGFHGPELGLQAVAGATGALVQTAAGISLVDYTDGLPRWSKNRFFVPVAVDVDGFIGMCERPSDSNGQASPVDDHITLCGLTENGSARWRVDVPWDNYGITPRSADGSVARWEGDRGDFVQAVAAKRWIVSSRAGTYAISGL